MIERAKSKGFDHQFLKLAREINEGMPKHTDELLSERSGVAKHVRVDDANEPEQLH